MDILRTSKMNKTNIKACLFPQPKSNGNYPIYIRINYNAKSNYVSLGYDIPKEAWNKKEGKVYENMPTLTAKLKETLSKEKIQDFRDLQKSIVILPNAYSINNEITKKKNELNTIYDKLSINEEVINSEILKSKFEKKDLTENSKKDFLVFIEDVANKKYQGSQIRTSEKYNVMLRKLKAFRKDKPLPIEELTTSFLNDFKLYLKKEGSHQNYIHVNLKALRTIIQKHAIKENKIISANNNPFSDFEMPKVLPSVKEKLDLEEIASMEALKLDKESHIYHVRNAFIFSLYNAGIRIGDLLQLKWCNIKEDGRLEYDMGKTGSKRSIKLLPQALKILNLYESKKATDYIFPFLDNDASYSKIITTEDFQKASPELLTLLFNKIESQIALYNKSLKLIALKSKIKKKVSSHIARHSFADIARKKVSVYDIQKMLGHTTLKVTESYLKSLDYDAMDKAMEEVLN